MKRGRSSKSAPFKKARTNGHTFSSKSKSLELKFHDLDVDDAAIAAGATIAQASCNIIAQGMTESTRIGRKCTIKSINWRMEVNLASNASLNNSDIVRVILFLDRQCNGAAPATTDLLEAADYQSFNNLANKSRFFTLMDRTYSVNPSGASGDGTTDATVSTVIADTFFKKVDLPIEYDNSASTRVITTQTSNNIVVMTLSRSGKAAFSSKMRLRFTDSS